MLDLDILSELPNHQIEQHISHVALYPRKSRPTSTIRTDEDIERDLQNQIASLKRLCEKKGWSYEFYTEIGSGENIKDRPKMTKLLEDVKQGKFDAILITEYTRLGRGSGGDQEKILITLRESATVIVEDSGRILNPLNEADLQIMNMQGFFSNTEYKGIVSKFIRGKREGARRGQWVSGHAPYGYDFNRKTRKLVINEKQGEVYRKYILLPYINGDSTSEIVNNLNKLNIHSPRSTVWTKTTVINLLKSEVYKGEIIYNKTVGSKSKDPSLNRAPYRKIKEENWIRVHNAHPPLKSEEEHEKVMGLFKVKGNSKGINKNYHPLSGLVKCFSCGKTLRIQRNTNEQSYLKACECGATRGGDCDLVTDSIFESAIIFKDVLLNIDKTKSVDREREILEKEVVILERELVLEYEAIERIEEAYEARVYDIHKMTTKKEKREVRIREIENELDEKRKVLKNFSSNKTEVSIGNIDNFILAIDQSENINLNKAYKTIIENVTWKRVKDEEVEVIVNFLT